MFDNLIPGISDTIHFICRVIEYCFQYFGYFQRYQIFRKANYGDIGQF